MSSEKQALAPAKVECGHYWRGLQVEPTPVGRKRMRRLLPLLTLLPLLPLLVVIVSCHKNVVVQPIGITVVPTGATLNVGMSTQFGVAVSGGTNNTVTWSVNGVAGGTNTCSTDFGCITVNGSTAPTISPTGATVQLTNYTAPATLPSNPAITITATSTDNTAISTSVTLTLLPPAVVTVTPGSTPSLAPGGQIPFTATVTPSPSQNVIWEVNGLPGGFQTVGLITNAGVYTAPTAPPPGGSVTITAVSIADTTQSGNATVGLTFGTASLQGPYAFTLKGKNAAGTFVRAGSFVANGSGALSGGIEDVTTSSGATSSNITFVGSYTMGTDGRGTLIFGDGQPPLSPSIFHVVMSSANQLQIISYDPTGTAAGQANLQSVAAFKTSSLLGTYLFDVSGLDSSGKPISQIGEFFANGQGGISSGVEDVNDNGVITSQVAFSGSYTVSSNGRGTAVFGTSNYRFYVVTSGAMKFVAADGSGAPGVVGQATQQDPQGVFSATSLSGNFAFLIAGANATGGISTVGNFTAGGNGLLTNGVLDENKAGTATQNQAFTGTYAVDTTGRGTAILSALNRTYTLVFYLDGLGGAVIQETDSTITSDGVVAQQSSATSTAGSYALNLTGMSGAVTQQFAGQMTLNGSGTISSGTLDISSYPGTGLPLESLSGALTVVSGTRGTLSLTPAGDHRNFVAYVVSPTRIFVLETDAGVLAYGSAFKQF